MPTPYPVDLSALSALLARATPGPWEAVRITNAETGGADFTHEEFATYVKNSLDNGVGPDIYGAMCQKADGPADVAHFGNGPTSADNLALTVALRNLAPALLAEVAAARDEVKRLREALAFYADKRNWSEPYQSHGGHHPEESCDCDCSAYRTDIERDNAGDKARTALGEKGAT